MKLLFTLLLSLPLYLFAQEKGSTKVIATTTDTAGLFNRIVLALYEKGYALETKDEAVGYILTKPRKMDKYTITLTMKVFVKGGVATFSGESSLEGPVSYRAAKKGYYPQIWGMMVEMAEKVGTVTYAR